MATREAVEAMIKEAVQGILRTHGWEGGRIIIEDLKPSNPERRCDRDQEYRVIDALLGCIESLVSTPFKDRLLAETRRFGEEIEKTKESSTYDQARLYFLDKRLCRIEKGLRDEKKWGREEIEDLLMICRSLNVSPFWPDDTRMPSFNDLEHRLLPCAKLGSRVIVTHAAGFKDPNSGKIILPALVTTH
ncbi:MAG: hypothetical protein JW816_01475 [Candidatus Buchananbacteria bacterium]|nr:hypothetical protein [Candidatus Buchananbacteria bacterium]